MYVFFLKVARWQGHPLTLLKQMARSDGITVTRVITTWTQRSAVQDSHCFSKHGSQGLPRNKGVWMAQDSFHCVADTSDKALPYPRHVASSGWLEVPLLEGLAVPLNIFLV